jgi:hypothetical protein
MENLKSKMMWNQKSNLEEEIKELGEDEEISKVDILVILECSVP